jgi:hypothetical protein
MIAYISNWHANDFVLDKLVHLVKSDNLGNVMRQKVLSVRKGIDNNCHVPSVNCHTCHWENSGV